jgi:type 1 glutamine amidotransferase
MAGEQMPCRLRAMLVTGGGLYETSFHSMLAGLSDVGLEIAPSDHEAFADSLVDRADVLILINRSPLLGETERQHFQDFAAAGCGIVVLNQAMANYPGWPWYRTLVGGRYLDAPTDGLPSSGFRLQEQIIAYPVGEHAITARLQGRPFHMLDETYSRMDIASDNNVLLRTRNSTADGPLIWTTSFKPARVVVILPGFGHGAHLNLAFRYLVEDAIWWAAQRERVS